MFKSGLVSITFRQLPPSELIKLVSNAGLQAIEWGGDVHVPHGETSIAKEVKKLTKDAGLECPSYGSYYRLAESEQQGLPFEKVLATAAALETQVIRVWAGGKGSAEANDDYWKKVVDDSFRTAEISEKEGLKIAYEFHGGTLTDTNEGAIKLLNQADHPAIMTYWQPANFISFEKRLAGIPPLLPRISNIHVFHWLTENGSIARRPLAEGAEQWKAYFEAIKPSGRDHYALLEFVLNDSPEQFKADAKVLKNILKEL